MITPSFKLDQNNEFLFINIRAPFAKLNDLDVFIEETDFRFYCKPYFLRLNLPASILENDDEIKYDFDERIFQLRYQKKNVGENFEGLELLTKLLTPNCAPQKLASNLIEEVEGPDELNQDNADEEEDDDIQWYVHQNVNLEEQSGDDVKLSQSQIKYGFAQTKSNVFSKLNNEYEMIIELQNPDQNTENRSKLRAADEDEKFDDDHYLADYFDDSEMIESLILPYEPDFKKKTIEYTEKEIETLKNLPKKKHLLDSEQKLYAYTGLVDILFAYCYTNRINCGEDNVEAGWTISKLSSTLSWFDTFNSLDEVLKASYRRSLCLPLYRNWKLSEKVLEDVIFVLKKGHTLILQCLLAVRAAFIDGENRYILNDLYINDYCVWIQYASQKKLNALVEYIEKLKITKEMVGFDLDTLELVANEQLLNDEASDAETSSGESSETETVDKTDDELCVNTDISQEFNLKLNLDGNSKSNRDNYKPKIELLD